MPLDHYVTLGRSGLRVTPLCLGAMTFGKEWGWGSEPEEARRFPTDMLGMVPTITFGGTTVDGQPSARWSQAPQSDAELF